MARFIGLFIVLGSVVITPVFGFGMTTDVVVRSLYATQQVTSSFSNDKVIQDAQDDAASFVASEGAIRGARLELALKELRQKHPALALSDLELAEAILAQ